MKAPRRWTAVAVLAAAAFAGDGAAAEKNREWSESHTGIRFVHIDGGCFEMGSAKKIPPPSDTYWMHYDYRRAANEDELPAHRVCVDAFWMGRAEVTVDEWQAVMGGDEEAVWGTVKTGIGAGEAETFARRLGQLTGGKARFRLPTEAEWEYACRAGGADTDWNDDASLARVAWHGAIRVEDAVPRQAGRLAANAWGLHDMLGNVWEWTADTYRADAYTRHKLYAPRETAKRSRAVSNAASGATTPRHQEANPEVSRQPLARVIRGGSVRSEPVHVRCAARGHQSEGAAHPLVGMRLVRDR